jgi:phosphatidylethanolamine-binding protein (PEBP) family uncharacterized protein
MEPEDRRCGVAAAAGKRWPGKARARDKIERITVGAVPENYVKNSFGQIGYGGPQPPKGTGDPYVFTLYALKVEKPDDVSISVFKNALDGKIPGSATITGKYGR